MSAPLAAKMGFGWYPRGLASSQTWVEDTFEPVRLRVESLSGKHS